MTVAAAENHTNGAPGRPAMAEAIDRARGKTDPPRERIQFDGGAPEGDENVRLLVIDVRSLFDGPHERVEPIEDVLRRHGVRLSGGALLKSSGCAATPDAPDPGSVAGLEGRLQVAIQERDELQCLLTTARRECYQRAESRDRYCAKALEFEKQFFAMREERDRLIVQLAACGVAALGGTAAEEVGPESYGYSASFGDVMQLRREVERLRVNAGDVVRGFRCYAEVWWVTRVDLAEQLDLRRRDGRPNAVALQNLTDVVNRP